MLNRIMKHKHGGLSIVAYLGGITLLLMFFQVEADTVNQPGEKNWNAKLKEKQVIKIKQLLKTSEISQREIAKLYNVSPMLITLIKQGKKWGHIPGDIRNETNNQREKRLFV